GGEQQRVALARALVNKPSILLADEPTGNLDSATSEEVMGLMQLIVKEHQMTLIMVTHDNHLATYADRVFRIIDGKIVSIEENKKVETEALEVQDKESIRSEEQTGAAGESTAKGKISDAGGDLP
ncbi:MAG TPA: hypothetical protein DCL38_07550, partial [Lachnospiraceae bacterium]|nr:hypothetical protein [Lachnospiraceae bacterium]